MSGQEWGSVTDTRKNTGNLSAKRNAIDACHWCGSAFRPDVPRYPIRGFGIDDDGSIVSVCGLCYKRADVSERTNWTRYPRECRGCNAPLRIPLGGYFGWQVCSTRCYQRALRKSKRENKRCKACRKYFQPVRRDARFCSNACRQWAYRRRAGP